MRPPPTSADITRHWASSKNLSMNGASAELWERWVTAELNDLGASIEPNTITTPDLARALLKLIDIVKASR